MLSGSIHQIKGTEGKDHDVIFANLRARYISNRILGRQPLKYEMSSKECKEFLMLPSSLEKIAKAYLQARDEQKELPTNVEIFGKDAFMKNRPFEHFSQSGTALFVDKNLPDDHAFYAYDCVQELESKHWLLNRHFEAGEKRDLVDRLVKICSIKCDQAFVEGIRLADGQVLIGEQMA